MILRQCCAFLRIHGYPEAHNMPIGSLLAEVYIVRSEVNRNLSTEAIATQHAIASVLSKEGAKAFTELVERLS